TAVAAAVHEQRADRRAVAQLLIDARDGVVVRRREPFHRFGAHPKEPDVRGCADLAAEPHAAFDGHRYAGRNADPPAEEQLGLLRVAYGELPRVLEEERSLLRKEQAEAVEVHLLLVDLDLREIG